MSYCKYAIDALPFTILLHISTGILFVVFALDGLNVDTTASSSCENNTSLDEKNGHTIDGGNTTMTMIAVTAFFINVIVAKDGKNIIENWTGPKRKQYEYVISCQVNMFDQILSRCPMSSK